MIRAALTALADRIMRPRVVCGICREKHRELAAHLYVDHGDVA